MHKKILVVFVLVVTGLLAQGQELPSWHPLVSGESGSVYSAGMSVRGRVVSEEEVASEDWPEHVVDWVR